MGTFWILLVRFWLQLNQGTRLQKSPISSHFPPVGQANCSPSLSWRQSPGSGQLPAPSSGEASRCCHSRQCPPGELRSSLIAQRTLTKEKRSKWILNQETMTHYLKKTFTHRDPAPSGRGESDLQGVTVGIPEHRFVLGGGSWPRCRYPPLNSQVCHSSF